MADHQPTYVERDDSGNITNRYVCNDKLLKLEAENRNSRLSYLQSAIAIFLPAGYPRSVSDDYLEYQIYDSLQAFSSSIAGLLSSRAVLQGVGVGDSTATATNAVLLNILQESIGRVATILFAHRLGTSLEPECKRYRFAADIFNDSAMILDCLSPVFPKGPRVGLLCLSGSLRALCGVAGGGSKASLSVHFAKGNNVGELNAKDSSQETVISLMGMLAGSLVVSKITTAWSTWTAMIFLVGVHLWTNYRAVKAVAMRTLNGQRANIVISNFRDRGLVLNPEAVARQERIFEWDGVLRSRDHRIIGTVTFERFENLVSVIQKSCEPQLTGTNNTPAVVWIELASLFEDEQYLLWLAWDEKRVIICLKRGCLALDQLRAWVHSALVLLHFFDGSNGKQPRIPGVRYREIHNSIVSTKSEIDSFFESFLNDLVKQGWEMENSPLCAASGHRIEKVSPGIDDTKKEN